VRCPSSKYYKFSAITLDKILKEYGEEDDAVFLKIDIESAEFDAFSYANGKRRVKKNKGDSWGNSFKPQIII